MSGGGGGGGEVCKKHFWSFRGNGVSAESFTTEVTSDQSFRCNKTREKPEHASRLLLWCHQVSSSPDVQIRLK